MKTPTPKINRLTFEAWADQYRPITNHLDDSASFDGVMFEIYGEELSEVLQHANGYKGKRRCVWTWIGGMDGDLIVEGYHLVNRIGYFITEKPAKAGEQYEITID